MNGYLLCVADSELKIGECRRIWSENVHSWGQVLNLEMPYYIVRSMVNSGVEDSFYDNRNHHQ